MTYDGETYYYITNMQGDVVGMLDDTGAKVITYNYTAYGQGYITANETEMTATISAVNPLLYRGYVLDIGTGLYYCQSRYYDPAIGRFINADAYPATGQGLTGNNMFTYCGNNPVNRHDNGGEFWNIVIGAVVGAVVSAATTAISTYKETGKVDIGKTLISAAVGAVSGGVAATGLGVFAQAGITAAASAAGSIATDLYSRSKNPNAGALTWREAGKIALRATGSAAIGFGSSIMGSAAGKVFTDDMMEVGKNMVFRGKIGAGCFTKAQARNLVSQGKAVINTARGISSVVGTIFTWHPSQAFSMLLS